MKKNQLFKSLLFLGVLLVSIIIGEKSYAQSTTIIKPGTHKTVKGHYQLGGITIGPIGTMFMNCDGSGTNNCRVPV